MIGRLKGNLSEKSPTSLIVDCSGIGFLVRCPLSTSAKLGDVGSEVSLYIYPYFAKNEMEIFGFLTQEEKNMFALLISCPTIGPEACLSILSRMDVEEIKDAIRERKADVLRRVPGIGQKKAEMILFKLQDKFKEGKREEIAIPEEAIAALISLGLSSKEAISKIKAIPNYERMTVAEIIKEALKR